MKTNHIGDDLLESASQQEVRGLVAQLPEDSLSLSWRSELNEKLHAASAHARRRRNFLLIFRPAAGLAAAAALTGVLFVRSGSLPNSQTHTGSFEAALVRDHRQMVHLSDVVGVGINPMETRSTTGYSSELTNWSELDLESL